MTEDELLTLAKVADETGYTQRRLRQLAKDGDLPAQLYGKTWLVKRTALDRFLEQYRPVTGRPRGSKNRPKTEPFCYPDPSEHRATGRVPRAADPPA